MKSILAMLMLAFGLSLSVAAQCGNVTLLSGCVGACGMSYSASYTVQPGDVGPDGVGLFCLAATSNSLCPNHDAQAVLVRNGTSVQTGNLDEGDVLSMKGLVGHVFTIYVNAVQVNDKVDCIWLGETHFSFTRQ